MALPLVIPLLVGGAFVALALSDSKKGTTPAGAGPGGGEDWFTVSPRGSLMLRPEKQPQMWAVLQNQFMQGPITGSGPPGALSYGPQQNISPVLAWISNETRAKGNIVLMHVSQPWLASVANGQEVQWCPPNPRSWAVLSTPDALAQIPGAQPGGAQPGQPGGFTIPGIGTFPIPGMPGQTQPAGNTQGQPPPQQGEQPQQPGLPAPGQTVQTPWGPMTVPSIPGVNAPAQGQQPPQQQPPAQQPPGTPQQQPGTASPPPAGTPISTPWGPMTVPSIPGVNAPAQGQQDPATGAWPADHLFTIRPGDMASSMALWYTGSVSRAEELRALNNLVAHGSGSNVYYQPWAPGQVLKLPLTWNVARGIPPVGYGTSPSTTQSFAQQQGNSAVPYPAPGAPGMPWAGSRDLGGNYHPAEIAGDFSNLTYGGRY